MRVIVMFIIKLSFVFKRDHVIRLQRDVCVCILNIDDGLLYSMDCLFKSILKRLLGINNY